MENLPSQQTQKQVEKEPQYKSYWHIMLIVINLSLSNFYFGYVLVYISTVDFQTIIKVFQVTMPLQTARGVLTGCIPFGALLGSLLEKKLIHIFSRRKLILFINAWALTSGSLLYVTNMPCFIIMRIIQGVCIGMYTAIIPMIISELSPVEISGTTGAFTQIFCSIGTTSAYLFYFILNQAMPYQRHQQIWYYVFGFPLIPVSFQTIILLFIFPYQTPKYFLLHHQKKKALALISIIYKQKFVDQILSQKIKDIEESLAKQEAKKQIKKTPENGIIQPPQSVSKKRSTKLISKISINSAISGVEAEETQSAPVSIFTSIHLNILRQFAGINAVLAYGGTIVQKAVPAIKNIAPIVLTFQTLLGALLSLYLLAKFGRKTIIQSGTLILAVSILFITIGFFILQQAAKAGTVLVFLGLIMFMFTFGATLGAAIWLYTAEICEPSSVILATAVTWIGASVVILFFPIIKNALPNQNPAYLFLFFFIWTTLSFILNHKVIIETKGKTEHQIQQQYRNLKIPCLSKVNSIAQQEQLQPKKLQPISEFSENQENMALEHQNQVSNICLQFNRNIIPSEQNSIPIN